MSRCSKSQCCKKVYLSSPACRCGHVFCPDHRMPDDHECTFDHVKKSREKIISENPVVTSQKIIKI